MPKVFVLIEADLPKHMDNEDFAVYAVDSIQACVGGYHPDDPVFSLDRKSVKGHVIQIEGQHEKTDFQNLKSLKAGISSVGNISIIGLSPDKPYGS